MILMTYMVTADWYIPSLFFVDCYVIPLESRFLFSSNKKAWGLVNSDTAVIAVEQVFAGVRRKEDQVY